MRVVRLALLSSSSLALALVVVSCSTAEATSTDTITESYSLKDVWLEAGQNQSIDEFSSNVASNLQDASSADYWDSAQHSITPADDGQVVVVASPEMQRRVQMVISDLRRVSSTKR